MKRRARVSELRNLILQTGTFFLELLEALLFGALIDHRERHLKTCDGRELGRAQRTLLLLEAHKTEACQVTMLAMLAAQ